MWFINVLGGCRVCCRYLLVYNKIIIFKKIENNLKNFRCFKKFIIEYVYICIKKF